MGLGLGREAVYAAHATRNGEGWRIDWVKGERLPITLFDGTPTPEILPALTVAVARLCGDVKNAFVPIQVALPDPMVSLAVFELDELPKTDRTRIELVRWRFGKELHRGNQAIECTCQDLGVENGKHLLLGLAVDSEWLRTLKQAFAAAGIITSVIDMSVCHCFNRFYEVLTGDGQGGALIALDPEVWTLCIWDSSGRLRFARSRWRAEAANGGATYSQIATEVERTIIAYVGGERTVAHLYVTGDPEDIENVSASLDQRMNEECVRLPVDKGFTGDPSAFDVNTGLAASALAAAVCR